MAIKLSEVLPGLKTHSVVIGALLVIWGGFIQGAVDLNEAISQTLLALGLSTVRLGVTHEVNKTQQQK